MGDENDFEQNRADITSIIKDGMIKPIHSSNEDGTPKIDYVIDQESAYYKSQSINSAIL